MFFKTGCLIKKTENRLNLILSIRIVKSESDFYMRGDWKAEK